MPPPAQILPPIEFHGGKAGPVPRRNSEPGKGKASTRAKVRVGALSSDPALTRSTRSSCSPYRVAAGHAESAARYVTLVASFFSDPFGPPCADTTTPCPQQKCDEMKTPEGFCQTCVRLRLECLGWGSRRPDWMRVRVLSNSARIGPRVADWLRSHIIYCRHRSNHLIADI